MNCIKCGTPLAEHTGPGRPPTYCSTVCRRLVEYEIRRLDRRLGDYEFQLREEQADRNEADYFVDNLGRNRTQRINDLKKWIKADSARLRELCGGT
ncbi:MAG: hypothetical protein H6933_04805 [Burkholderiaceae bacterium]|nr:hypothetical protein [Rhodoferax sp.]MCP5284200.1 hypothetical protein [Burkholderiaceae bacterium]